MIRLLVLLLPGLALSQEIERGYVTLDINGPDGPKLPVELVFESCNSSGVAGEWLLWHSEQTELAIEEFEEGEGKLCLNSTTYDWCIYLNYFGSDKFVPGASCDTFITYGSEPGTLSLGTSGVPLAIESSGNVYKLLEPEETTTEIAIVFALILFLAVWLTLMKSANPWEKVAIHSDIVADVVILTLTTMILAIAKRHPTVHSREVFAVIGDADLFIDIYGYGVFPFFGVLVGIGLLFGQGTLDPVPKTPWFGIRGGFLVYLVICGVAIAITVEVMLRVFEDNIAGTIIGSVFTGIFLAVLLSKKRIIYESRPYVLRYARYAPAMLLLTRIALEFLVLSTIHANLPVVFSNLLSTTYKNGIGFSMGLVLSFVCGRDGIPASRDLPFCTTVICGLVCCYVVMIMLVPGLYATNPLRHHPSEATICGVALSIQLVGAGSVWAILG